MTRALLGFLLLASAAAVIPKFFAIGFTHILPYGLDHILFLLGLFFLTRSFGVLLFQMTLFTIANSLTLGLSLYGVVSLPTQIVKIAIEDLFRDRLSRWRPASAVITASGLYWAVERSW